MRQTDFTNDEAVGYLADRLARLGVEEALAEAGAVPGDMVTIGINTFDWEPSTPAGVAAMRGNRGTDPRLEGIDNVDRASAAERRAARDERRRHRDRRRARRRAVARGLRGRARRPPRRRSVSCPRGRRRGAAAGGEDRVDVADSVDGGLDVGRLDALVDAVAARAAGTQVVLVSSGAIAAGLRPLGLPRRPRDLATQQAAAGVGQLHLTRAYAEAFARHGRTVGQVLLTSHDVVRRQPYRNAQRTFERLLGLGVVPVVNENDTVATDEIRFGDNDRLAALVAHVISADALVLLSDVDGVYDADPRDPGATLVREVTGRRRPRRRARRQDLLAGHRRHGLQARRGRPRQRRRGARARGRGRRRARPRSTAPRSGRCSRPTARGCRPAASGCATWPARAGGCTSTPAR